MKQILKRFLHFVLFSNIFIALCATAQGLLTYHLLNFKPNSAVLALLFFATLTIYNFSILIEKPANSTTSKNKRVSWIFEHYKFNVSITVIAFTSLIPLFLSLNTNTQTLIIFLGLLSFAYSFPIFKIKNKKVGLRNLAGLKLFLIAFVWAISTVTLPILEHSSTNFPDTIKPEYITLTIKRFLFIAAITIPFDIRDIYQDKKLNLKTIATLLGEKKTYLFCKLLLLSCFLLELIFNQGFNADVFALIITILLSAWLIFKSDLEKNEYYYFFYLDGILILQVITLIILNYLI